MTDFAQRVAANLAAKCDVQPSRPVIVAISGGADSVALLAAMCEAGYECVAAHCNFHLRGEESNRDMRSVYALCIQLGVDLYVRDFDVPSRQKATGESVEMACRALRYEWFADLLDSQRAQAIAVAHHSEDNVETFFLNLTRGSGLNGLTGMRWRNGYVVRPLLDFTREEIEAYLREKGIAYVEDSTNAENDYARNRWRNMLLPAIETAFPGALRGVLASISHLADNNALYKALVQRASAEYLSGNQLRLAELIKGEPQHRMLLFEMLKPLGFNMAQVGDMLASANKSGLTFAAGETMIELDRGVLKLASRSGMSCASDCHSVTLKHDVLSPVHILISEHPVTEFKPERNVNVAYFDKDVLEGNPEFCLRHWLRGDKMHPYGMRGRRLLSDIFSDAKYSAADKRSAWLLTRNDEIIWVLGLRASAAYSIKPETRRYLRLELR